MINLSYPEYYNQNSQRNYPFDDLSTLKDNDGVPVPLDYIVDINIMILDMKGTPYIKQIDLVNNRILVGDSSSNNIYGFATITGEDSSLIYDNDYMRQIGIIVFGGGKPVEGWVYNFKPEATTLAASTWGSIEQKGVKGFLLEDGTLVTGDVKFVGQNGLKTLSYYLDKEWFDGVRNVLKIDAAGAAEDIDMEDTKDCLGRPIECIRVVVRESSKIMVSDYEKDGEGNSRGLIAITPRDYDLFDLCKPAKTPDSEGKSYREKDICDPPKEEAPPKEIDEDKIIADFIICPKGGSISFISPSAAGVVSPISIKILENDPSQIFNIGGEVFGAGDKIRANQKYLAGTYGSIVVGFKGLIDE